VTRDSNATPRFCDNVGVDTSPVLPVSSRPSGRVLSRGAIARASLPFPPSPDSPNSLREFIDWSSRRGRIRSGLNAGTRAAGRRCRSPQGAETRCSLPRAPPPSPRGAELSANLADEFTSARGLMASLCHAATARTRSQKQPDANYASLRHSGGEIADREWIGNDPRLRDFPGIRGGRRRAGDSLPAIL